MSNPCIYDRIINLWNLQGSSSLDNDGDIIYIYIYVLRKIILINLYILKNLL